LSDKDEIKELFNKELNNYSAEVDPSVWNSISQSLGSSVTASTVVTKFSLVTKALIISGAAAIVGISAFLWMNINENISVKKKDVSEEKVEVNEIIKEEKSTVDLTVNDESELVQEQQSNPSADDNKEDGNIEPGETLNKKDKIVEPENNVDRTDMDESIRTVISTNNSSTENDNTSNISEETTVSKNQNEEEIEKKDPLFVSLQVERKSNQHYVFEIEASEQSETYLDFGDGKIIRGRLAEYVFDEPGSYVVQAVSYNDMEEVLDEVVIDVKTEGKFTNLPNVFSPNGDGVSDEFFIQYEGIDDFQLTIFNQKSEVVFETNEIDFKWRGIDRRTQQQVPAGNYYYIIIAQDKAGNVINKHQTLSIFRN